MCTQVVFTLGKHWTRKSDCSCTPTTDSQPAKILPPSHFVTLFHLKRETTALALLSLKSQVILTEKQEWVSL